MPPTVRPALLPPLAAVLLLASPSARADSTLALKRVLLSTGGVGYFEHEATVTGDAALTLDVRRDQVDDVLKSVVVYDDRGGVGTITLAGEEPTRDAFRDLPIDESALASPAALFAALRGAEVRSIGFRHVSGRILSVTEETTALPERGGTVTRHRMAVLTPDGVQQVVLEDADSVTLADAGLQARIGAALAALARQAEGGRRTLTIHATGSGERTVRVGYVVEAPLWKATYRLTLPGGRQGGARDDARGALQGWAVLENASGADWRGVDLTVLSGDPVTFRQALYAPYFVERPEVPVEVAGRVLPRPDEGATAAPPRAAFRERAGDAPPTGAAASAAPLAAPPAAPLAMPPAAKAMAAPAPMRDAEPRPAESREATAQVVFHYPKPVTLANGGSLMLPIAVRAVPASPFDLYQPATQPRHPLAAVRLRNDGDSGLPPGVLTLYERAGDGGPVSYIGDARLAALPAGEERLLSFAVDRAVSVDRDERPGHTLSRLAAADGVLQVTVTERQTTTYTIAAAGADAGAGAARTVIVEHPRRPGWDLAAPAATGVEVTATAYRLPVTVPAGGTATLAVTLERPRVERLGLADLQPDQVTYYAGAQALPSAARAELARLATLRAAWAGKQRRVADLEREQADLVKDQERLRANLGPLPKDSDLARRTLAKMGEEETRLDQIARELTAARTESEAARQALVNAAKGMKF